MPFLYLTFAGALNSFLFCNSKANGIRDRQAQCTDKCNGCTDRPSQDEKWGDNCTSVLPLATLTAKTASVATAPTSFETQQLELTVSRVSVCVLA